MKKMKIIGKILSPIVSEVLRVKKWKILHFTALSGAILCLPRVLARVAKNKA